MNDKVLWYTTRGSGAVALVLLTAVISLGILSAIRWQRPGWPRFLTVDLHRDLSLLTILFLAVHIVTSIVDPFTSLGLRALIPFASAYRPLWLGVGAVSLYLLLALVLTSLLRTHLGLGAWRAIHWSAYLCWPAALLHGLGTGSDSGALWQRGLDVACAVVVAAAGWWRLTVADRGAPEDAFVMRR